MTKLSVNLNKIALLRNSRGRDFPNVVKFAKDFIDLGVHGITVHPRPDERHVTVKDAVDLAAALAANPDIEFNVEGYPSEDFLKLVENGKPDQCTLVPDSVDQLTSDHGWDFTKHGYFLKDVISRVKSAGIRAAVFLDPDLEQVTLASQAGTDRIELHTEAYASSFHTARHEAVFRQFEAAAIEAQKLGLGVNAGHDLDLNNLPKFLEIGGILEVSIGHALTVECIEQGMKLVIPRYLTICNN
jgi:pyridoxine 5-phosphate synthase